MYNDRVKCMMDERKKGGRLGERRDEELGVKEGIKLDFFIDCELACVVPSRISYIVFLTSLRGRLRPNF